MSKARQFGQLIGRDPIAALDLADYTRKLLSYKD